MLDLNRVDFNNTEDIKDIKKLKKNELLQLFKNPEKLNGLLKKELLELLLENKFFLILRRRLANAQIENMNLHFEISKLKRAEKVKKYLDLEEQYQELVSKYKSLKHKNDRYTESLESQIRELNSKIHELERERDYYKDLFHRSSFINPFASSSIDFKPYYRKLAKYLHPDKQNGDSEGMQILNELKEKLNS